MHRIVRNLIVAVIMLLGAAATSGCHAEIIAQNARASTAGFLTGIVSGAINRALYDE